MTRTARALCAPDRMARATALAADAGLEALLITPGPDLRYLTGYEAMPLERLTCLVLRAEGDPVLVVPALEQPPRPRRQPVRWMWRSSPGTRRRIRTPSSRRSSPAPDRSRSTTTCGRRRCCGCGRRCRAARARLAGDVLRQLRMRSPRPRSRRCAMAGAAIDRVHARCRLAAGRPHRGATSARDIAAAIRAEGHARVDFAIVGSGPNGASPHHELSGRVIEAGDLGRRRHRWETTAGYWSDCTRSYVVGGRRPPSSRLYAVLQAAQAAAVGAGAAGGHLRRTSTPRPAGSSPTAGRRALHPPHRARDRAGDPRGRPTSWPATSSRSSPGWPSRSSRASTCAGRCGARIEDIVVCVPDGVEPLNRTSRELVVVEP